MGIIKRIHHIELVTKNPQSVSDYLRNSYGFQCILKMESLNILQSGDAIFVVKSIEVENSSNVDSVYDIALEISDFEDVMNYANENNISITRKQERIENCQGYIDIAQIKSCVGNVVHTLINKDHYHGDFLPGYETKITKNREPKPLVKRFDHITYAVEKGSSSYIIQWYSNLFKMTRKYINKKELVDEGFVIAHKTNGMRLKAFEYWLCDESFVNNNDKSCKFVVAEELNDTVKNQIGTFLQEHGSPGIQHIGLLVNDIVQTSQICYDNGAQFIIPPSQYYEIISRNPQIERLGLPFSSFRQYGILIDVESEPEDSENTSKGHVSIVFTKPIFDRKTFFLELIERWGAEGFGSGNIKALWNAFETFIESNAR